MLNFINGEIFKLKKSTAYLVIVLVAVALGALTIVTMYAMNSMMKDQKTKDLQVESYVNSGLSQEDAEEIVNVYSEPVAVDQLSSVFDSNNLMLLIGIFIAIFVASDYSTGTIRQVTSRGISRDSLFFGKYITGYFASLVLPFITLLISFSGISLIFTVGKLDVNTGAYLLRLFATILITVAAYVSFAMLISIALRSLAGSITTYTIITIMGSLLFVLVDYILKKDSFTTPYWFGTTPSKMCVQTISTTDFLKYGSSLLAIAVICTTGAYIIFKKQEF